jgi:hypothetical protein
MKYWRIALCGLMICLGACNAFGSVDTRATMQAEQTAYVEESTQISGMLNARGTEVVATARAAQTYVANAEGINRQLAVTLRAVNPPTQQVVDTSGQVTPGMIANPGDLVAATAIPVATTSGTTSAVSDVNQLTEVQTAAGVRDADGCANSTQIQFSTGATSIYLTGRILNATAGTIVSAEWLYEGQVVLQSQGFTINQNEPDFCVWFYIEPTDVAFSPGNWSARFLINGGAVEPSASFTIG